MIESAATEERSVTEQETGTISFVTFEVAGQLFGVPVMHVQDILAPDAIAPVPGGPVEVKGLINLRGRIVTVIDLHTRLGLKRADSNHRGMCVTVENDGESYTLFVDSVGDVVSLLTDMRDENPATLDAMWKEVTDGVYRVNDRLLVTLDVGRLLSIRSKS